MRRRASPQFNEPRLDTIHEKSHDCRFPNFVSSSQFLCHPGVINDKEVGFMTLVDSRIECHRLNWDVIYGTKLRHSAATGSEGKWLHEMPAAALASKAAG